MNFPHYGYLLILLVSLVGLVVLDRSQKLALFSHPRRAAFTILASVAFFVLWDIAGIGLGIFQTNPTYVTGLYLVTPNLPVEELLLLTLISYLTLLLARKTNRGAL